MGAGNINVNDILSLFGDHPAQPSPTPQQAPAKAQGGLIGESVPPLPERNPIFRPEEGETIVHGGLLGGSVPPKPSDTGGPGQNVVNTPLRDNNSVWRDKGYTLESVAGTTPNSTAIKSRPDIVQQVVDAAPQEAPANSPRASLFGDTSNTAPVQAATNETTPATTETGKGLFASKMIAPEKSGFLNRLESTLQNSNTNPLLQIGLGLLASGYDGTNPYTMIQKGLGGIQNQQIAGVSSDTSTEKSRTEATQRAAEQQAMLRMIYEMQKQPAGTGVAPMRTQIVK